MLVRPKNLGAVADNEDAKVGIEETEEVVRIRDDVPSWVLV